ncbi:MAG TPA: hypothetical protein VMG80_08170, partial [Solirubrobacteraceae bacterium]|nr:hypothetical protein [Solirubrobacteraceae bacterium]
APIKVFLRVEGSTQTLFEGPVDVEPIFDPPGIEPKSGGNHPCDVKDNGENGGFGAAGAPPTAALYDAATTQHLAFDATWYESIHDFDVAQVGEDVADSGGNEAYWGYAVNYTTAEVGGCQIRLSPGSEVLWAYNFFGLSHLLDLSGPSLAQVGVPFTVHVVDGQTGQAIAGAAIGEDIGGVTATIAGSPVTDTSGNATLTLSHAGAVKLKATAPESVRSNGLSIEVATPGSVACACASGSHPSPNSTTPDVTDLATIEGVAGGHVYPHRSAPRLLAGTVTVPAGGTLREVKISLKRTFRGRCFGFSGSRESFTKIRCRRPARFFSVGSSESFSYLLPARLPPGRYVYDIEAVDDAGQATKLVNGVSQVVFTVR